jgi:ABC-2 type transport system ATP-binding protein
MRHSATLGAGAPPVITVEHLRKAYGATVAVDDVSFSVGRGEIFGVLGRNGAGKTATLECISGLRVPDAGEVRVLGLEPRQDREELHERLGVQLQQGALPPKLRVGEAVQLYASFYDRPADAARLLERLGLEANRGSYWRDLSGGQKQRLSIALALIGQPEVAVLDELTTGLDPEALRETWDLIAGVRDSGVTIVLVTHFMDEAERLCDRVALIDQGKLIALGKPARLAEQAATARRVRLRAPRQRGEQVLRALPEVSAVEHHGGRRGDRIGEPRNRDRAGAGPGRPGGRGRADRYGHPGGCLPSPHVLRRAEQCRRRSGRISSGTRRAMTAGAVRHRRRRARAFWLLVATEAKLAWRLPTGLIFGLALPALLLVIFGAIPALSRPKQQFGGISFFSLYAPTLILLVLLVLSLLSLPMQLAGYREQGVLRRIWTTPVAPSFLLAAQLALNLALAAAGIGLVLGVGAGAFGLVLPADAAGFALSVVLSVGRCSRSACAWPP